MNNLKALYNKIAKLFKWALLLSPFGLFAIICIDSYVLVEAENQTFQNISQVPFNKVGLLLGTSKYMNTRSVNPYYKHRVEAAVALYNANKIEFVLVSGDNGSTNYNEPLLFKNDLIKLGIPEDKIFLDYAGFSTLDSILRAQKIFGLKRFTVISQKFHNERALFLANQKGIKVIGFNAKDVVGKNSIKTELREYLARTKACLDILLNAQPKYLGEKIAIQ